MTVKNAIKMSIAPENWPIAGSFTIARGSRTQAMVVVVTLKDHSKEDLVGKGECVPYARYDETVESVCAQLYAVKSNVENGLTRAELQDLMPAGAARNALDCALWDLEAKRSGLDVANKLSKKPLTSLITAYTISLGTPHEMAKQSTKHNNRELLKIKLGGDGDHERMTAVREAAPNSRLILDANEAWPEDKLQNYLSIAADINAELVEQPLPADNDGMLARIDRTSMENAVMVCADESVHTCEGLSSLRKKYDCINIKLDKTGGLTQALQMFEQAKALNFSIMVGCMVGTSLAMAPAVILAQVFGHADFVDLDGPLLLAKDREHGLSYPASTVTPPSPLLWG